MLSETIPAGCLPPQMRKSRQKKCKLCVSMRIETEISRNENQMFTKCHFAKAFEKKRKKQIVLLDKSHNVAKKNQGTCLYSSWQIFGLFFLSQNSWFYLVTCCAFGASYGGCAGGPGAGQHQGEVGGPHPPPSCHAHHTTRLRQQALNSMFAWMKWSRFHVIFK